MANTIDTSTIEGFSEMTPEQQVAALTSYEIPEAVDLSGYVKKSVFDAKASEAANLAKQVKAKSDEVKAKMTEEEQRREELREAAEAEKREKEELLARIAELERNNRLNEYRAELAKLQFDEKLIPETAVALADNDVSKIFANLKKFLDTYKKNLEAEFVRNTPQPGGSGISGKNDEDAPDLQLVRLFAKEREATRPGTGKSFLEKWHK